MGCRLSLRWDGWLTRTLREIEVEGRKAYALFDIGSMRSYVRNEFASNVRRRIEPFEVSLGGHIHRIRETSLIFAQ
jgi:hypothetical protein